MSGALDVDRNTPTPEVDNTRQPCSVPHMDIPPAEPLLTLRETADRLRVSQRTVHRYIKDGRLPSLRTPGGDHRIRLADVEAALTSTAA